MYANYSRHTFCAYIDENITFKMSQLTDAKLDPTKHKHAIKG